MSELKKRKDGRYQRRITLSNGKTKLVYGRTKAELSAAVRAVQAEDSAGLEVGDHTLVGEWAKIWLDTYKSRLRPATVKMYRDTYNLHIMDAIGGMELREVRPVHVRRVMASVADKSDSLQHKVLLTMRQIFTTARQNHLIAYDPTDGIKPTPHARPAKKQYLTQEEGAALISAIDEPRAKVFCALCFYCGLRREEALGLQWTDISPAALVVSRAVTFPDGNQPDLSMELKTKAAHRIIPIPVALRKILDETPHIGLHVVPNADGSVMTKTGYTRMWAHVTSVTDIPIHAHMLRHSYATSLYRAGIDLRTAQQLLGHATIEMTANIYTHLEASDSLQMASRLDEYFSGKRVGPCSDSAENA